MNTDRVSRWIDPTLPGPWAAVYLAGSEGWTVLAPWTGEGEYRCRPHVAEVGGMLTSEECRAEAERIVAWRADITTAYERGREDRAAELQPECEQALLDVQAERDAAVEERTRLRAALDDLAHPERDGQGLRHRVWDTLASLSDAGETSAYNSASAENHDADREADIRRAGAALAAALKAAP